MDKGYEREKGWSSHYKTRRTVEEAGESERQPTLVEDAQIRRLHYTVPRSANQDFASLNFASGGTHRTTCGTEPRRLCPSSTFWAKYLDFVPPKHCLILTKSQRVSSSIIHSSCVSICPLSRLTISRTFHPCVRATFTHFILSLLSFTFLFLFLSLSLLFPCLFLMPVSLPHLTVVCVNHWIE